jgi:hypothetical protein
MIPKRMMTAQISGRLMPMFSAGLYPFTEAFIKSKPG